MADEKISIKSVELTAEQQKTLGSFVADLANMVKEADYDEVYGYQINTEGEYVDVDIRNEILLKFLIANNYELAGARKQLVSTLKWRKKFNPLSAAYLEKHEEIYSKIGALTNYPQNNANQKIITWNLYGNIKSPKELFNNLDQFLRWRVGLMEKSISYLEFANKDDNYIAQVHDYQGVSFLRVDPDVKKGTKSVIDIFGNYYPELLSLKFFINVPAILTWVFNFISKFISRETTKKFVLLSDGNLTKWFGVGIPKKYGGNGSDLFDQNLLDVPIPQYASFKLNENFANEVE